MLAETGDHSRVKNLARDGLRTARYHSKDAPDESFYNEFNDALYEYQKWHAKNNR